jgi:pimeloyl-ACP methyl ester carboxylesterase
VSGFQFSTDASDIVDTVNEKGPTAASNLWLKHPYMAPAVSNIVISGKIRQIVAENSRARLAPLYLEHNPGPPAINRLSDVHAPALIIVGDRDIRDIRKIADLLAAGIPGAKKQIIHGSGHILNIEKPDQFDKIVLEFLTAHSQ